MWDDELFEEIYCDVAGGVMILESSPLKKGDLGDLLKDSDCSALLLFTADLPR